MVKSYAPQQGDIIFMNFDPQSGHEQGGRRPAIVISNQTFHKYTKMAIVCPITNTDNRFPLHVPVNNEKVSGVVLCEQVKCLDIVSRNVSYVTAIADDTLQEILDIVGGFF